VSIVILIALFERLARVADGLALLLGRLEGDVLAIRLAAVVASGRGCPKRPTGRGGNRSFDARQADAGDFVAVLIHLRDEDRIGWPAYNRWRVVRQDAIIEIRPEVEEVAGRDDTGVKDARDVRPAQFLLRHDSRLRTRDRHCERPVPAAPALRHAALRRFG